jgi:hypothetical protein
MSRLDNRCLPRQVGGPSYIYIHEHCITALGDFDPNQGRHFVLGDFNVFVKFPSGSTILIPSASTLLSFQY